jgi:hypothetical protein
MLVGGALLQTTTLERNYSCHLLPLWMSYALLHGEAQALAPAAPPAGNYRQCRQSRQIEATNSFNADVTSVQSSRRSFRLRRRWLDLMVGVYLFLERGRISRYRPRLCVAQSSARSTCGLSLISTSERTARRGRCRKGSRFDGLGCTFRKQSHLNRRAGDEESCLQFCQWRLH